MIIESNPSSTTSAVIKPETDLVASKLPTLRSKLQELVSSGIVTLTLDLTGVRMVDSAGIGLLIAAHNTLKKTGGTLSVVNATADILDLFRTMRIHQHFSIS